MRGRPIAQCGVVVGYKRYLDLIDDLTPGKELISSGMTKERDRCKAALDKAQQGETVALISSGDAGIYGMAGLALEMAEADNIHHTHRDSPRCHIGFHMRLQGWGPH